MSREAQICSVLWCCILCCCWLLALRIFYLYDHRNSLCGSLLFSWSKWSNQEIVEIFYQSLILKRLLPVAMLCAAGAIPISQSASGHFNRIFGIYQREHFTFGMEKQSSNLSMTFRFDLLLPFRMGLLTSYNYDLLYETTYIGYALFCLALIGMWLNIHRVFGRFAILPSFCPLARISFGTKHTQLPTALLFLCPLYSLWRLKRLEYIIPATLCLSLLAASGVELLLSKIQSKGWQKAVGVEIILLISLELFFIAPTIVPVPVASTHVPSIYYDIAEDKEDYAIFDYPTRRDKTAMIPTEYFFYQSIHNKGIPYAIKDLWSIWTNFGLKWRDYNKAGVQTSIRRCSIILKSAVSCIRGLFQKQL